MKRKTKPYVMDFGEIPPNTQVLVIAPHPDDETFGCGGTILKHKEFNHDVCVAILTDGSKGIKNKNSSKEEIVKLRKKEATKACESLEVDQLYFFDIEDKKLIYSADLLCRLQKIIRKIKPSIIYTPHLNDNHIDHSIATKYLQQSKKLLIELGTVIYGYEIWSYSIPSCYVDITDFFTIKQTIIKCYKSQQQQVDYLSMIKGLNMMRGSQASYFQSKVEETIKYAEAFIQIDKESF